MSLARNTKSKAATSQSVRSLGVANGSLRVFYEVDALEPDLVNILAIGIKRGNRLLVAGEEIDI
jgi:hypothetical protein